LDDLLSYNGDMLAWPKPWRLASPFATLAAHRFLVVAVIGHPYPHGDEVTSTAVLVTNQHRSPANTP
jgi:hypothetical protein